MGLDIVEFVVAVEEAFALGIPNDVAAKITTPRMLINYVHSKLPQSRESCCLSQRAFYAVRRVLGERLGLSHTALRPSTELLRVLPARHPCALWAEVGTTLGCSRWPTL